MQKILSKNKSTGIFRSGFTTILNTQFGYTLALVCCQSGQCFKSLYCSKGGAILCCFSLYQKKKKKGKSNRDISLLFSADLAPAADLTSRNTFCSGVTKRCMVYKMQLNYEKIRHVINKENNVSLQTAPSVLSQKEGRVA